MIHSGDCLTVLPTLEADSVDAVVTDPPYGLEFMGKEWDRLAGDWRTDEGRGEHALVTGRPSGKRGWDKHPPLPRFHAGPQMQQWHQEWATATLRVLKPGGYLLAFGGTRTFHRLACALEDAGFEIRDTLCWLYGSGFPKGKGCLKPAWEPVLLCRRPGPRVLPLGVDECRVETSELAKPPAFDSRKNGVSRENYRMPNGGSGGGATSPLGRWPANVAHDGSEEVLEAFAAFGERQTHATGANGTTRGGQTNGYGEFGGNEAPRVYGNDTGTVARFFMTCKSDGREFFDNAMSTMKAWTLENVNIADGTSSLSSEHAVSVLSGAVTSASRGAIRLSDCQGLSTNVTPTVLKAICESAIELTLSSVSGLWRERLHAKHTHERTLASAAATLALTGTTTTTISPKWSDGFAVVATFVATPQNSEAGVADFPNSLRFTYCAKASRRERGDGNNHPTVKPLALISWLVKLVCPEGGTVLDPFLGSGTTALACLQTGRKYIGIEKDEAYVEIARRRIREAAPLFAE